MKLYVVGSNQIEISFKNGICVFFSYDAPVVIYVPEMGYTKTAKHYSVTTSKHINAYLKNHVCKIVPAEEFEKLLEMKIVLA